MGAVAIRELAAASLRVDNPALLDSLPDLDVPVAKIVAGVDGVDGGRTER